MYRIKKNALTDANRRWVADINRVTLDRVSSDLFEICDDADGHVITARYILIGAQRGACVIEYSDNYVIPQYSRFDRMMKDTGEILIDINF